MGQTPSPRRVQKRPPRVSGDIRNRFELLMPLFVAFHDEVAAQSRKRPDAPVTRVLLNRARRHDAAARRLLGAVPIQAGLPEATRPRALPPPPRGLMTMADLAATLAELRAALDDLGRARYDWDVDARRFPQRTAEHSRDMEALRRELAERIVKVSKRDPPGPPQLPSDLKQT